MKIEKDTKREVKNGKNRVLEITLMVTHIHTYKKIMMQ